MKKLLSILFLFRAALNLGQIQNDYIKYYNLCNKGDNESYNRNYIAALKYYDSAFTLVNYCHSFNLEKAALAATKTKQFYKAIQFLRKAILNGKNIEIIKERRFKKLKRCDKYSQLKDSAKIFENNFKNRINMVYAREIDSLQFIDQNVIRGNTFFKNHFHINPDTISKKNKSDSLVFRHLLYLIGKYGFPSEKLVGPVGYESVSVILHHNVRLPENEKYIEMATKALLNGEYLPKDFAWMYDQSKEFKKEKPFFYYAITDPSKLTTNEIEKIENNRLMYGVKPMKSYKITVIGKMLIQRELW